MSSTGPSCETKKAFDAVAASGAVPKAKPKIKVGKPKGLKGAACATGAGAGGAGLIFPSGYGFVVVTAVGSIMMVAWKSVKVGIARDELKIPYPQTHSDNVEFNCVVRAHQNTLEHYPQFLLCLMIGGLEMPYFCALGGWIWIIGRILYAKGNYSGDPTKRARGTISLVGMLMLMTATMKFAMKRLRG